MVSFGHALMNTVYAFGLINQLSSDMYILR